MMAMKLPSCSSVAILSATNIYCGMCNESKVEQDDEFVFGSLTFLVAKNMLSDPNVWIADTGASTHTT